MASRRDTAGRSTLDAHMPDAHLAYQQIGAKSIRAKASKIGPSCRQIVDRIMADQRHIEQGFRQCQGILRLQQTYGHERLEAGCARAVYGDLPSFRSIESILKSGLDKQPLDDQPQLITNHPSHVRGSSYYLKQGDA